jgi:hypothetical protein
LKCAWMNYLFITIQIYKLKVIFYFIKLLPISCIQLCLIMFLFLQETNIRISFTQKQVYGIKYLQPLRELRESIFETYLIEQELKYNFSGEIYQNKRKNANQRTLEILQRLIAKDRQWGKLLPTTSKLNQVKNTWLQLGFIQQVEIKLQKGEIAVLYTDGITEV